MRWTRTFIDSPEAIRKLQLTMNGLRTSGIVHRDQNGNDSFYYPGSQYVTEMLGATLNAIGIHTTIPLHRWIFEHPNFLDGQVDTTFIERTWQKGGS